MSLMTRTPIEAHPEYGLWVKREDLSCPPPGPPFSKTRGVYAHMLKLQQPLVGVLDTYHSQAGHAVAHFAKMLGKRCLNFYPEYKHDKAMRSNQLAAQALGAELRPLKAGRSCVLFHEAKRLTEAAGGYMMPNALKLWESVEETAKEVLYTDLTGIEGILVPSSSATLAAGVLKGLVDVGRLDMRVIIHLGYTRPLGAVMEYVHGLVPQYPMSNITIVDEGYQYADKARDGATPPWPCNPYYDLKAFRWWDKARHGTGWNGKMMLWNIG